MPSQAAMQAAVIAQIAPTLLLVTWFFSWAPERLAVTYPALAECAPSTLTVLLPRLLAASALPVLAGVVLVGNARFLTSGIDPLANSMQSSVLTRFLSNTVEQYILHAAAVAGLAAWGHCAHAAAAVPCFLLARLLFLIGYLAHPVLRAVGFAGTAYPTAAALAYCSWRMAKDGPLAGNGP